MSKYSDFVKKYGGLDVVLPPPGEKEEVVELPTPIPPPSVPESLSEEELADLAKRMYFKNPEMGGGPTTGVAVPKKHHMMEKLKEEEALKPKTPSEIEAEKMKKKTTQELFKEFEDLLQEKEALRVDDIVKFCEAYDKLSKL